MRNSRVELEPPVDQGGIEGRREMKRVIFYA